MYRVSSNYSDPYFLGAIKLDSGNLNTLIRILRNTYSDQYSLTSTMIQYSDQFERSKNHCDTDTNPYIVLKISTCTIIYYFTFIGESKN